MSDGTRYHKDSLTCAHKRYPLGSKLKVTNVKNGKSVIVKVTDRCGSRRIIDLSYAAAKKLDIIAAGIATVRVERYFEFKGVPFKPEYNFDLPELDYEVTEGKPDSTPLWMKDGEENAFKEEKHEKKDKKVLKTEHETKRNDNKTTEKGLQKPHIDNKAKPKTK